MQCFVLRLGMGRAEGWVWGLGVEDGLEAGLGLWVGKQAAPAGGDAERRGCGESGALGGAWSWVSSLGGDAVSRGRGGGRLPSGA